MEEPALLTRHLGHETIHGATMPVQAAKRKRQAVISTRYSDAPARGKMAGMTATDPLLQPFQLRHLALRNRFLSTAHEPAYTEDGMPKARYRLYHEEKATGGIALTMIGGSAVVSPDSPPAFGNILLYKDEVVAWLGELADAVHA